MMRPESISSVDIQTSAREWIPSPRWRRDHLWLLFHCQNRSVQWSCPYEYLVYLFDSLPYKEDKSFDYTSYLPWAEGIRERVKEYIANKFAN